MRWAAPIGVCLIAWSAHAAAQRPIEVPFRWTPGQIEIQVSIDGRKPIWFILDSGAEMSMLDAETADTLGLGSRRTGGGRQHIDNLTLDIGPLRMTRQSVTLWALDNFRRQKREIRGVIGCPLFERYVVTIDFQKRVLVLTEPASFRPDPAATRFPIAFAGRLPVVETTLTFAGRPIPARLMVDTGASQAVILRHPFATGHRLFGSDEKRSTSDTVAAGRRTFITLSADALQLGRWTFPRPAVEAYGTSAGAGGYRSSDGLLGNDVLRHFRVTFDYSRKQLFLQSNAGR